eukprot:6776325-Prymnesium_polylepis.1
MREVRKSQSCGDRDVRRQVSSACSQRPAACTTTSRARWKTARWSTPSLHAPTLSRWGEMGGGGALAPELQSRADRWVVGGETEQRASFGAVRHRML